MGCIDTSLSTSDLRTKMLAKRRIEELIAMMPLHLGAGLLLALAVQGRSAEEEGEASSFVLFGIHALIAGSLFLIGWWFGAGARRSTAASQQLPSAPLASPAVPPLPRCVEAGTQTESEGRSSGRALSWRSAS